MATNISIRAGVHCVPYTMTGTSAEVIYTAPSDSGTIIQPITLHIANNGSSANHTVEFGQYRGTTGAGISYYTFYPTKSITGNSFEDIDMSALSLRANDTIRVTSAGGTDTTCFLSFSHVGAGEYSLMQPVTYTGSQNFGR